MAGNKLFDDLLRQIKEKEYSLIEGDLLEIKQLAKNNSNNVTSFCLNAIKGYYQDDDNYLENEPELTEIVATLLSFVIPDKLDEEQLFEYILHTILVNRSKGEKPEKGLNIIDNYFDKFKGLQSRLLVEKAFIYHNDVKNREETERLYNEAIKLARQYDDDLLQGKILYFIGDKYGQLNQHTQAITYYRQSLDIYLKYEDNSGLEMQGNIYCGIGYHLDSLQKYNDAILAFKRGQKLFEALGKNIGIILFNLALVYYNIEQYDHAIKYGYKAFKQLNGKRSFFKGQSLYTIATSYWKLGMHNNSIVTLKSLIKQYPNHSSISLFYSLLGLYYFQMGNYVESINAYSIAIDKLNIKDDEYVSNYTIYTTEMADSYLQKGEIDKSEVLLMELSNKLIELNASQEYFIYLEVISAACELAKGNLINSLKLVKQTNKIYRNYNNKENLSLKGMIIRAKNIRKYIFMEHSIVYSLIYPFLKV